MKKNAIFGLFVLAPCLAVGLWGLRVIRRDLQREQGPMRKGFVELCRETANAALARCTDGARAAGPARRGVRLAFAVNATGELDRPYDSECEAERAPDPAPEAPPELLEARRLEFLRADTEGALRAYRLAVERQPHGPAATEGRVAIVGLLLRQAAHEPAAAELQRLLESAAPGAVDPDRVAYLATAVSDALAAGGARVRAAALLVAAWPHVCPRGTGPSPAAESVRARLESLARELGDAMPPEYEAIREWWRAQAGFEKLRATGGAWLRGCLAGRAGSDYLVGPDSVWLFVGNPAGTGLATVIEFDPGALAALASEEVAAAPELRETAERFYARYSEPVLDSDAAVDAMPPWQVALPVRVGWTGARRGGPWLNPANLVGAGLAFGILLAVAGYAAVLVAVRRELRLARLRSDFVSNVSHELQTPLSLVKMYGEMLDLGYAADEEERRRYYGIINKEATRLSLLIRNVLDFARIEKGRKAYRFESVRLGEVVEELAKTYGRYFGAQGFALNLDLDAAVPAVRGDRQALTQAVLNLLSNAAKYSAAPGEIGIGLRAEAGWAVLSVSDQGIGVPEAERDRIFEPFHRADGHAQQARAGTGLGLSVVKHIVQAHGGAVGVESRARGSTFFMRFPSEAAEPGAKEDS
ncbi:MAG: HAMP domain-containing histidine kinase [Kiritimatiellae bacterium]|nr:HAMP domain-containing histidine kinase [Kiritimatiellia bacterium]